MDPQVQASFIPKKPLDGESARPGGGVGGGIFFLGALLIFIASAIAGAAAFGYQSFLNQSIANKDESLNLAEGAFEPGVIQDLVRLDQRLIQSRTLLQSHVAPSALFDFLSLTTLQNVQFNSFSYELGTDGSATIALAGVGNAFSDVALQSDQLGSSRGLSGVVFSGVTNNNDGRVNFAVTFVANPSLFLYSKHVSSGTTTLPQPLEQSAPQQEAAPLNVPEAEGLPPEEESL